MAATMARRMPEHEATSAGLTTCTLTQSAVQALRDAGDSQPSPPCTLSAIDLSIVDLVVIVGSERDVAKALPATLKRVTWPLMEPNDPPASPSELKDRYKELRIALDKHLLTLAKMHRASA